MNLNQWAIRWGLPFEAVEDLRRELGLVNDPTPQGQAGASEASRQALIRVEASDKNSRLWRNNVGAFQDDNGRWVRYGLCNDSKQVNEILKSSDLIGLRPVRIMPHHVGLLFGMFVARETKPEGWQYTGTTREVAQLNFLNLVLSMGGDAAFATGPGTLIPGDK